MTPRRLLSALLALTLPLAALAGEPDKKKAAAKKKAYDYERSKYKSREFSENSVRSYRFNEKGEPIAAEAKKKAASKKKRSEPPEDEAKEKKAEADAL